MSTSFKWVLSRKLSCGIVNAFVGEELQNLQFLLSHHAFACCFESGLNSNLESKVHGNII